jgi:hypothetical protein
VFGHRAKAPRVTRRKTVKASIQKLGLLTNFAEANLENGIRQTANNLSDHPFACLRVPLREASIHFGVGCPADPCSFGTFFTLKRSISADTLL